MAALGDVVKQYRERKGWSQGQLAAYSGMTQPYLSQLESGQVKSAKPPTLQKLADALGAPLKEFLEAAGIREAPDFPIPEMPREVAALQEVGVPDAHLRELTDMWSDMTEGERELTLSITRSVWERRQRRKESRASQKAGDPHPSPGGA